MYATNVNTGRIISTNTALYKKLKKLGQTTEIAAAPPPTILEHTATASQPTVPQHIAPPAPPVLQHSAPQYIVTPVPLREKVIEASTDIIAENKKAFTGITQQESDELLRKLLYEKLCITPKTAKTAKAPPPPSKSSKSSKPSTKKKKKKYVVSSSEESDSD